MNKNYDFLTDKQLQSYNQIICDEWMFRNAKAKYLNEETNNDLEEKLINTKKEIDKRKKTNKQTTTEYFNWCSKFLKSTLVEDES